MFEKTNETENNSKITKQDIIDFINNMNMRSSGLGGGGLDKVDVYFHIQQIVVMYDAFLKGELDKMEKQHEEELNQLLGNVPEGEQGELVAGQSAIKTEFQIIRELQNSFKEDKQEIIDYINKMNIRKATFGGLNTVDVYAHIQDIVVMQDKMNEKMRKSYENEITRLHRMLPRDGL